MPAIKEKKQDSKMKMNICDKVKIKETINVLKQLNKKFVEEDMKKQPLLEDTAECPIYIQVLLKKIPPSHLMRMIRVPLPHSLLTETSEVCLITGDLDKRNHKEEIEPTVLHYKDLLRKHGITRVSQVIPLRQLRTEYKTFESKRQLAGAYDVFLVDKKVAGVLPKVLGKSFIQSRKFPIQIDMNRKNLKDHIDKALCQTEFSLTCRGNSYALEVARMSMEDDSIMENIKTSFEILADKLPGNESNILSLYLKTAKSKALPIFMSFDVGDDVSFKKFKKSKCRVGELSTMDNTEVKVFRDGKVIVRKLKKELSSKDAENDKAMDLNEADDVENYEDADQSNSNKASVKKRKRNKADVNETQNNEYDEGIQVSIKKKRKSKKTAEAENLTDSVMENLNNQESTINNKVSPKKKGRKSANFSESINIDDIKSEEIEDSVAANISSKKKRKGRKSVLDQVTEMKSEEKSQTSSSIPTSSKKRNKKNKNSEADETVEDTQENGIPLNSRKQKISQSDNVTLTNQKGKKRKVPESDDNVKTEKNKKSKSHKNIHEVAVEDSDLEINVKSKEKKSKGVEAAKKKSLSIAIESGKKTPSRSRRNKKMKA